MGAWGYEPMDSDQSLDWLADNVTDEVGKNIRYLIERAEVDGVWQYAYELRAAADVVIKLNFFSAEHIYGDLWSDLAQMLSRLRASGWTEEWDDPDAVRTSLTKQIDILERGYSTTTLLDNLEIG